ncbi:(2Fe-2S)-binding protein [Saccharospirillum impatiens]|uniref:(2Fe-2S)-binding protein n=1 Tax=Saccharospirillum impatiens TaxID=169438 RepID=UPI000427C59D|nr:(2Fe-2S)-binding protein [Saccharospirillum impatiens]
MSYEAQRCPGLDEKGQVAFLVGDTAYYLLTAVAALYLAEGIVPSLDAGDLALADYDVHWDVNGESGTYKALEVQLLNSTCWAFAPHHLIRDAIPLPSLEALRDNLRRQLEQLYQPLIERLYQHYRLGKAAQWRLVADALAAAFLNAGRQLGDEDYARQEALALIKQKGSPLHNKQTGYFEVTVTDPDKPDRPVARQHFRARGGCCRYYTTEAATYCSTCVLFPQAERDVRLQAYLKSQHELSAV